MSALPALSIPGWTQATIGIVAILSQLKFLYDPSSFMTTFDIPSIPAARLNAFYVICIDIVWLLGALQDNQALYWVSIAVRGANAALFWSFGGKWTWMAYGALLTMTMMCVAMIFDRKARDGARGRGRGRGKRS